MFRNTSLILLATIVALVLGELMVRLVAPQNLSGAHLRQSPSGYLVNRSDGMTRHQLGERVISYRFSYPHLRGDAPNPASRRILVLGDSFTFGYLLPESATYVADLQQRLDREFGQAYFQLLNMGTGGWGLSDAVRAAEEFGEIVDPVAILVFLNTDDIGRSLIRGMYTLSDDDSFELTDHSGDLPVLRGKSIVNRIPGYQWLLEHSHAVNLVKRAAYYDVNEKHLADRRRGKVPATYDHAVSPSHAQRLGQALIRRLNRWCVERNIALFVTSTGFHHFSDLPNEPTRLFMQEAPRIFAEESVPFFDFSAELVARYGGDVTALVIPGDHHPNEKAAASIAAYVWPWLRENLINLPSSSNGRASGKLLNDGTD